MSNSNEYLSGKREAFRALRQRVLSPDYEPTAVRARVTAEGRSGIRRIRLRDHQVLTVAGSVHRTPSTPGRTAAAPPQPVSPEGVA